MVEQSSHLRSMWTDVDNFFDNWNALGGGFVLLVSVVGFYWLGFTSEMLLVSITALYAFVSFNQMRETRWNRRPSSLLAVRPHFQSSEKGEGVEFGLKNFGDSPALNLRLCAILRKNRGEVDRVTISNSDWHLHLDEGGFLSLSNPPWSNNRLGNFADSEDPVYNECTKKSIELYYTFESNQGVQYPRSWSEPMNWSWKEVVDETDNPRAIKLEEIRKKCC